jgi:ABC-type dipeptide/oligopeptide/nickel transport system permease component
VIAPLTILGPIIAAGLTGSPFVELIFRVPGMGRYFFESILTRLPGDQGGVPLLRRFLPLMNLGIDLLYGTADPRIRFGRAD